ncbi:aminoglycoside phosphotransferase family protein [Nitrincola sp.]|uniref:aminoglycoside phosphotransferase family protein n=1 Tax=Nitrincola sp. TaxID=1926584 RepID=UPI003A8CB15D
MGRRQLALKNWVAEHLLGSDFGLDTQIILEPVAGDASFRRYFRVQANKQSFIVMDAPPEHEDCRPFVAVAQQWLAAGVRVPKLLAEDLQQGFLLLEDFGDQLFYSALSAESADGLYSLAFSELHKIQCIPAQTLPPYDEALLRREMHLFREWFLQHWLGLSLSDSQFSVLARVESLLVDAVLAQPQVTVHRDYHSRNLMLLPDAQIGVIDFQDAVAGALTYDLVSLLRDSYIHWPEAKVAEWVVQFQQQSPVASQMSVDTFKQAFDWMGMQRHLKVCGIFARLCLRDGKTAYLQDIPLTLRNLYQSARRYPQFAEFAAWLESEIIPAVNQQPELRGRALSKRWYI